MRVLCGDGAVKLSIKSFTVPELFVDLPETASIASLKVEPRTLLGSENFLDGSELIDADVGVW